MKSKQEIEYLKQKIHGLRNNPKRCMHEVLNFVQGNLLQMTQDNVSDVDYWNAWGRANAGINVAISHFNHETEIGQKLIQIFLFIQNQLKEKPSNDLITEICGIIKTIKGGFNDKI